MENPPRSRTTWEIAVDTTVVSMAASAIAVISAISTGRRCAGRAAGWAGAVIVRQPMTKRTSAPFRPGAAASAPGWRPGPGSGPADLSPQTCGLRDLSPEPCGQTSYITPDAARLG